MINFYKNIWFYVGLSLIGLLLLVIFNAPTSWYYYDILICAIPGLFDTYRPYRMRKYHWYFVFVKMENKNETPVNTKIPPI